MKYSQTIGIIAAILLIGACFLPWSYIPGPQVLLTGFDGKVNDHFSFGRAGIMHSVLSGLMILCYLSNKVFAKRTNVFVGAVQIGWALKNLLVFATCRNGECPQIKYGLYITVVLSFVTLLMTLLPTNKIKTSAI